MPRDPRAVVVPRRVHAHEVEPVARHALHARAGHDRLTQIVAETVVVAGDDRQPTAPEERRKRLVELLPLPPPAAMRDVSRDEHVVDAKLDERARELIGLRVVLGAPAEVKVRKMRQHLRAPNPPQVRDIQYFSTRHLRTNSSSSL